MFFPRRTEVWVVDAEARRVSRIDGRVVRLDRLKDSGLCAIVNPSFLLQDNPPFKLLLDRAATTGGPSVCANIATNDGYGFAWREGQVSIDDLWGVLHTLTATIVTAQSAGLNKIPAADRIAPSESSASQSPTMENVRCTNGRRAGDAPIYVNTAFCELVDDPQRSGIDGRACDDGHEVEVLLKHRDGSKVPWIFNAIINEIEYQRGVEEPSGFPPEMHLSLTGACNLECRFCAYTDNNAIYKFQDQKKVEQLDFLRHMQILRLSSGLGEPTLNRHFSEIINFVAEKYPHLILNFFTNGIALYRPGLIEALLNQVQWINVSINAASAESWRVQHQDDHFERVSANLSKLTNAKRERQASLPLAFGSMVLNGKNLSDLPRMPALCRSLGIDRLTAFPYSALGYHTVPHTFGASETFENFRAEYDDIHDETVREAALHQVSLEIPAPAAKKTISYGLEVRSFYDFARIERNEWQLGKLAEPFLDIRTNDNFCRFLWRQGCVGSTHKGNKAQDISNYMYPCIGPLSSADLSQAASFSFPREKEFLSLWNNPVFRHLRSAQKQNGTCAVCDKCRHGDSRDANNFASFERLVADFMTDVDRLMSTTQDSQSRLKSGESR